MPRLTDSEIKGLYLEAWWQGLIFIDSIKALEPTDEEPEAFNNMIDIVESFASKCMEKL